MGLYVCDKCGCIENTAYGSYWTRDDLERTFGSEYSNGQCLCSECTPNVFANGDPNHRGGKWHNRFPKKQWDGIIAVVNRSVQNG